MKVLSVLVGATRQMSEWLDQQHEELNSPHQLDCASDIRIAHCLERILSGRVMRELVDNDARGGWRA